MDQLLLQRSSSRTTTKPRGGSAVILHPQPIYLQMQWGEHLRSLSWVQQHLPDKNTDLKLEKHSESAGLQQAAHSSQYVGNALWSKLPGLWYLKGQR